MLAEKRQHSTALVPYTYYECSIPDYFPFVPLHWHGEFELNYVLSGSAEFIYGDERFISHAGDVILLPPNLLHAIYPNGSDVQRYDTLVFSGELLGSAAHDRCTAECIRPLISGERHIVMPIHADDAMQRTVERIFACAKVGTPHADLLLKSEMLRLLWQMEEQGAVAQQEGNRAAASELIRPAIEYIHANLAETISIDTLAQITHLSKSYFMGQFKKAAGVGAIEYINQLRIKRACHLLTDTAKSVAEIAFACGFRNLSNFNRQFRGYVSCTPGEYRRSTEGMKAAASG